MRACYCQILLDCHRFNLVMPDEGHRHPLAGHAVAVRTPHWGHNTRTNSSPTVLQDPVRVLTHLGGLAKLQLGETTCNALDHKRVRTEVQDPENKGA